MAEEVVVDQTQTTTQVADVVVTAAGFEQRITQAPASISVLTRKQLESERHQSLAEALANIEGVDVGASAGKTGGLNISIRGMPSDYTLILIAVAGVVVTLGFGLYNLNKGGEGASVRSNKLMRLRIILQAVAVLLLMIGMWLKRTHAG